MKRKLILLTTCMCICILAASIAYATTVTQTGGHYKAKYTKFVSGSVSQMTAAGTTTDVYTVLRNTSSSSIKGYVKVTRKDSTGSLVDEWAANTNNALGTNVVVVTPYIGRAYANENYRYVHKGEAYNYQNQTKLIDSLTYTATQFND